MKIDYLTLMERIQRVRSAQWENIKYSAKIQSLRFLFYFCVYDASTRSEVVGSDKPFIG